MDRMKILQNLPLLNRLSDENRSALAEICLEKKIAKKDVLFLEGAKGYSLYILVRGRVQLTKSTSDGKETVIRVIKPGEMFADVVPDARPGTVSLKLSGPETVMSQWPGSAAPPLTTSLMMVNEAGGGWVKCRFCPPRYKQPVAYRSPLSPQPCPIFSTIGMGFGRSTHTV